MPEVKASPATADRSLSHSRYSLATDILKNLGSCGEIRQGFSIATACFVCPVGGADER
jgi:hypothetical protein